MKLFQDFGVRALIAVIALLGGFGVVFYILSKFDLEPATLVAIIAVVMTPGSTATAFYFGERKAKRDGEKEDPKS